jgi:hypothetical protein
MSLGKTVLLLFMVLISLVSTLTPLYLYVITFRSMCAVHNMAVFCSYLTSWFPGTLLTFIIIIIIIIYYHHHHHHHHHEIYAKFFFQILY